MKRLISLILILVLISAASISFAAGGKIQERNPEIRGDVDPPVMRQLITNGAV